MKAANSEGESRAVRIPIGAVELEGTLTTIPGARQLVLFVHGSGSSRHSARNQFVARILHSGGISTLLFDLLTEDEESLEARTRHLRFDISMLAERLLVVTKWILAQMPASPELGLGYFGSSTGGAAALVAAAALPDRISAVVSRGGRPDLAGTALETVRAPTLLIVGGDDTAVLRLNEQAYLRFQCERHMRVIPGATHLFEEQGTLQLVADLAVQWFKRFEASGPAAG